MTIRKLLIIGMSTCAAVLAGGCDRQSAEPTAPVGATPGTKAPSGQALSPALTDVPEIRLNTKLPPSIADVNGFGQAEPFGRWTVAKTARIEFVSPLPREFILEITCGGFGPNIGAEARVGLGGKFWPLRIEGELGKMKTSRLSLDNDAGGSAIVIEVPKPTAPESLGNSRDGRLLGIIIWSIRILPAGG